MSGSDGLGFLGILKKSSQLRFQFRQGVLIFGARRGEASWDLRDAPWVVGLDGTVSIVKIVCLSLSCRKPKSQEGNKSFVPEPRESSVFRVFRIPMRMNILCIMYLSHIRRLWLCHIKSMILNCI